MGDLEIPKCRDDSSNKHIERLHARISGYRSHHERLVNNCDPTALETSYNSCSQETAELHQRWLESKVRKQPKSRTSGTGNTNRNNLPPRDIDSTFTDQNSDKSKKRKVDNPGLDSGYSGTAGEFSPPPSKSQRTTVQNDSNITTDSKGQVHSSVSVNIDVEHTNQSHFKLTVNTIQTSNFTVNNNNNKAPNTGETTSTTHSVETNICKQEPKEETCSTAATSCQNTQPSSASASTSLPSENLDNVELEELLSKVSDNLPESAITELQKHNSGAKLDPTGDTPLASGIDQDPSVKIKTPTGNIYGETVPSYDQTTSPTVVPPPLTNVGGMTTNTHQGMMGGFPGVRSPTNGVAAVPAGVPNPPPGSTILGDTGPAAETLKKLAAQHNNQEVHQFDNIKSGPMNYDSYPRNSQGPYNGYPGQNFPGLAQQPNNGMYYNQQNPHMPGYIRPNRPMNTYDRTSKDLTYGGTKPLTHYACDGQTQSSLQQLQNQVQSHFSQSTGNSDIPTGPMQGQSHLQMSQQMNMTHSGQRMHLSQSQQLDIQGTNPQNISVGQQQSFQMNAENSGPGMPNHQYMSEQMKMQVFKQQQTRNTGAMPMPQGGGDTNVMGYMNRPPPDYKPPCTTVVGSTASVTTNNNPLQTMQNMVNQTSPIPDPNNMYVMQHTSRTIKQEPMTNDQLNRTSPMVNANIASIPSQINMSSAGRPCTSKSATPNYTSAIMRNQRAPNVNVGPHGLNISHQRAPQMAEWSQRGPSAGMHQINPNMMGNPSGHMGMHQMQGSHRASMMQYGPNAASGYHNSAMMHGSLGGPSMRMAQPSHQSMAMHASQHQNMTAMAGHPNSNNMVHMQQQQHMQMHQQGGPTGMMQTRVMMPPQGQMSNGMAPNSYGMPNTDFTGPADPFMSATGTQPTPAAGSAPYMDMMQQQASKSSEFLEEILGNKPC